MSSILVVTPRYGDLAGGAEANLSAFAHRLHEQTFHSVEIATTTAIDHHSWQPHFSEGTSLANGIPIHRFPATVRSHTRGPCPVGGSTLDELRWFGSGMWSPGLSSFLRTEVGRFDVIIAGPYLLGTTIWTCLEHPNKTLILPCLHDEPEAHSQLVGTMLHVAAGVLFNTAPEQELARRLHGHDIQGSVIGIGIDLVPPQTIEPTPVPVLPPEYLVYCGRMEEGKGVDRVVESVTQFNAAHPSEAIDLVLIGGGPYTPPEDSRIHSIGYVDEYAKRAIMRRALALANFSRMESLSLVLLEAWREGTPAIVAEDCEVLAWQVRRCGGGFVCARQEGLKQAIRSLREPATRARAVQGGLDLLTREYSWSATLERLNDAISDVTTITSAGDLPRS